MSCVVNWLRAGTNGCAEQTYDVIYTERLDVRWTCMWCVHDQRFLSHQFPCCCFVWQPRLCICHKIILDLTFCECHQSHSHDHKRFDLWHEKLPPADRLTRGSAPQICCSPRDRCCQCARIWLSGVSAGGVRPHSQILTQCPCQVPDYEH